VPYMFAREEVVVRSLLPASNHSPALWRKTDTDEMLRSEAWLWSRRHLSVSPLSVSSLLLSSLLSSLSHSYFLSFPLSSPLSLLASCLSPLCLPVYFSLILLFYCFFYVFESFVIAF